MEELMDFSATITSTQDQPEKDQSELFTIVFGITNNPPLYFNHTTYASDLWFL